MQISGISSTLASAVPATTTSSASKTSSASSTSSTSSTVYDPRDTNQDGVVSAEEALQYALLHPEAATTSTSSTAQSGTTGVPASSGSVNLYA